MDFRTMRLNPVSGAQPSPEAVDLGSLDAITPPPGDNIITLELPGGGVEINFNPVQKQVDAEAASDHDENLALHVQTSDMTGIADSIMQIGRAHV